MPHHAHSIDRWDDETGSNLYEHLAEDHPTQRGAYHRQDVAEGRLNEAQWPASQRETAG